MAARHPYMNNTCPANVFDVADAANELEAQAKRIAELEAALAERRCVACGQPWTGEPCGQKDNDWPFPVCTPSSS
jgi:hypothetical protein